MEYLKIKNWDRWQTYRSDRGQPPWIKIHRCVMRNPEWVSLTDAEKGQLLSLWLLAADKDGTIPADPDVIKRICYLEFKPDLNKFLELGFVCLNGKENNKNDEQDEQDEQGEGKIYFIEYEGSIKIGFSKNPWARLNSLKTGMPNEPKLLSHFDGTKEKEQQLHKLFEPVRINREWYKPHPYLIELTTCGLPDAIPETLTRTTCGLPDQPEKRRIDKSREEKTIAQKSTQVFDQFWSAYPKKRSKGDAEKAWKQLKPKPDMNKVLKSIEQLKKSHDWQKENGKYIPYPATWLRAKGWEDEVYNDPLDGVVSDITKKSLRNMQKWMEETGNE